MSISGSVLLQSRRGLHWPSDPPTRSQSLCQRWPLWSCCGSDFYHFWRRRWRSFKQQGICGRDEKQAKTWLRKAQGHWPLQLFDRRRQMCQIDPQDSHWGRGTRDLSLSHSLDFFLHFTTSLLWTFFVPFLSSSFRWKTPYKYWLWFCLCLDTFCLKSLLSPPQTPISTRKNKKSLSLSYQIFNEKLWLLPTKAI